MKNGRVNQLLPLITVLLILLALVLGSLIVLQRETPDRLKFEESLFAARVVAEENKHFLTRWELIRASRHAVSMNHWMQILRLARQIMPMNPKERDYRLFTKIASRAVVAISGNQKFLAYLAWGELRSGDVRRAVKIAEGLYDKDWTSLKAEIKIADYFNGNAQNLEDFYMELESHSDAEFFTEAAELTESAALTVDAALAYMERGQPSNALELAQEVMAGNRWWKNQRTPFQRRIFTGLGRIAYDAGDTDKAIQWIEMGLEEARNRRTVLWEDLQFLSDIFWEKYQMERHANDRTKAQKLMKEALELVYPNPSADPPRDAWSIWLGLSAMEASEGNVRQSEELLRNALSIFPKSSEVRAVWARKHVKENTGLSRRLVQSSESRLLDPVLEIASLQVDPQYITPRLYEAKLWNLFNEITKDNAAIHPVDARMITTFLLEYMSSLKNYASIDIAVDRYRKIYPDESWILSWRLAVDASRTIAIINLVSAQLGTASSYNEYRQFVREEKNWRGLYDTALFAIMASEELIAIVNTIPEEPTNVDKDFHDSILINSLKVKSGAFGIAEKHLNDRIRILDNRRTDMDKIQKLLGSNRRKGEIYRAIAKATLVNTIEILYSHSMDDLQLALEFPGLSDAEQANLYYLQAYILRNLGRFGEMRQKIDLVLEADPFHPRIRELSDDEADY